MRINFTHKILVAPLDWGLGHATRCIPLVKCLQKTGCEIFIACEGSQKELLQAEFKNVTFFSLRGYRVQYSQNKRLLVFKILWQLPKILLTIQHEHRWLQKIIAKHRIDMVISDNRYGLWTKQVPCVFITHQLEIKAPFKWVMKLLQKINYSYINRYTECWMPDFEGDLNLAGNLSHPETMPAIPVKYIGPLARFNYEPKAEKKYDWLIILSGPEPQRTLLEQKILKSATEIQGKMFIVRGKPGDTNKMNISVNCEIVNHLPTAEMEEAFAQSEYIISRSGYTTIMELLTMQKKSMLIPTPGQTEQEYLAAHLVKQQWAYSCRQNENLLYHLEQAKLFSYQLPKFPSSQLEKAIAEFINNHFPANA